MNPLCFISSLLIKIKRTVLRCCKRYLMSWTLLILRGWNYLHTKREVFLAFGLINGRRTEYKKHHPRFGLVSKRLSWGVSFLKYIQRIWYESSSHLRRITWVFLSTSWCSPSLSLCSSDACGYDLYNESVWCWVILSF